eukprot:2147840-Amphidinium_carterae.1
MLEPLQVQGEILLYTAYSANGHTQGQVLARSTLEPKTNMTSGGLRAQATLVLLQGKLTTTYVMVLHQNVVSVGRIANMWLTLTTFRWSKENVAKRGGASTESLEA